MTLKALSSSSGDSQVALASSLYALVSLRTPQFRNGWSWAPLFQLLSVKVLSTLPLSVRQWVIRLAGLVFGVTLTLASLAPASAAAGLGALKFGAPHSSQTLPRARVDESSPTPRSRKRRRARSSSGDAPGAAAGADGAVVPASLSPLARQYGAAASFDDAATATALGFDLERARKWAAGAPDALHDADVGTDSDASTGGVDLAAPMAVVCGVEVPARNNGGAKLSPSADGADSHQAGPPPFVATHVSRRNLRNLALAYLSVRGFGVTWWCWWRRWCVRVIR